MHNSAGMMSTLEPLHQMVRKAVDYLSPPRSQPAAAHGPPGSTAIPIAPPPQQSAPHSFTNSELSFIEAYERELNEAWANCRQFERTNNQRDITTAWDVYYHVFKRISKQLQSFTSLDLANVSPKLLNVCLLNPF